MWHTLLIPSLHEAEAGISPTSRLFWYTKQVQDQPGLYSETFSQNQNKILKF